MHRRARAGLLIGLGISGLAATGCDREENLGPEAASTATESEVQELEPHLTASLPAGMTAQMVQEGRRLFIVCAVCHGLDARGNQLGPSLRDQEWIHISGTPEEIAEIIRVGVAEPSEYPVPMPVMGGGDFTPEQIRALAAYTYAVSRDSASAAE